jgi:hypothetical protein
MPQYHQTLDTDSVRKKTDKNIKRLGFTEVNIKWQLMQGNVKPTTVRL